MNESRSPAFVYIRSPVEDVHVSELLSVTKNITMPVQWTSEMEESLIERVRSRPSLWNPRDPSYETETRKKDLYGEIARELQEAFPRVEGIDDADAVMMKFKILKTSFRRELAKIKNVKSGAGGDYVPKWRLFDVMLFLTDVVTPRKSTSNLETTVSQESQSSHQQESQTSNQQESQLSKSLLVQADPYQSDDEVFHQSLQTFNYDSSVDDIDLPNPSSSHSGPGTSRSSSPWDIETCGRTSTPKRKRSMTPDHAPSAIEVALSFLKTTAQAQRKEDIPHAAGVFVREVFSEFPRHKHPKLMLKLAVFLNKLKEEEGS
ncbi:uncharacterized protein [Macrobrachium rosenbergii]|uniref:uncharacterized protein n=1 Tax=Macrobrachium rosenbergii TaxID=79674 RepID=UPI0034D6327F